MLRCKVRESMMVTEENLTVIINEMIAEGYELNGIHFAMRDNSKRPSMAFLTFYREEADDIAGNDAK